ncbi:MAG: hypothetical protein OEX08_00330 [Candidatus Nomurabacteria bacterium]|nr:hypothetical protein [Candidatus Nomurabacteria bacterium]
MAPKNTQASQDFVDVSSVRDRFLILKQGGIRAVLLASAINLSLKSADEQQATILQYQNFLNSLDFSIQMVVQSRKLDMRAYLLSLEERSQVQKEELLQIQTREYIEFIRNFMEQVNVMDKKFYVVIPYDGESLAVSKGGGGIKGIFGGKKTKSEQDTSFERKRAQIEQRIAIVQSGLGRIGVRTEQLDTEGLVELLYSTYNPGDIRVVSEV